MHPLDATLLIVGVLTTSLMVAAFFNTSSYFSWHQVCNAVALGLMSVSAPLARARHGKSATTRKALMFSHVVLNTIVVALMLYAFLVAYTVKETYSKPHIATTHAWFGCAAGVCWACVQVVAYLTYLLYTIVYSCTYYNSSVGVFRHGNF